MTKGLKDVIRGVFLVLNETDKIKKLIPEALELKGQRKISTDY